MTAIPPVYQWPKPSEHTDHQTMVRLLNQWKPAGLIEFVADGVGSVITSPDTLYLPCPKWKSIIMGWTLIGDDPGGSIEIDIWKSTYPTIPTVADSIVAAAAPALVAQQINRATSIPTWTTDQVNEDDILAFHINSATLHTRVTLSLAVARGDRR